MLLTYYITRCVKATPRRAASALDRVVGQFEILSPPGQAATVHLSTGLMYILPVYWHDPSLREPVVTAGVSLCLNRAWPPIGAVLEVVPSSPTTAEVGLRQVDGDLRYFGVRRRCQYFELQHEALDFVSAEMQSWLGARQAIGEPAVP
jgi:hypothetical protein